MQEDKKIGEYSKEEDFNLSAVGEQVENKENWKTKLENFLDSKYFVPVIIILIAIIAFSLGRISGLQEKRPPVRIISDNLSQKEEIGTINSNIQQATAVGAGNIESGGQVVASKNGTKYHYPWCGGAKQIAEKNLITFNSIKEARAAGYTPAANCKGLK